MAAQYTKSTPVSLKDHPDFTESWLQDRIAEDPTLLGLGDVTLLSRERRHRGAGRLDLLLFDEDANTRYEVELMLGSMDESHIIRTLEYWDIERRRYPAYEHRAVIVAESISSRFLNVIGLFSGSIPLIALQIGAFQVGGTVSLSVVRVMDLLDLREDEGAEPAEADRAYWVNRVGKPMVELGDQVLQMVRSVPGVTKLDLKYNLGYIGLHDGARSRNFIHFTPKKSGLSLRVVVQDTAGFIERFKAADIDVTPRGRFLRVRVSKAELDQNEPLIRDLIDTAVKEYLQD